MAIDPNPVILKKGKRVAFAEVRLDSRFSGAQLELMATIGERERSIVLPITREVSNGAAVVQRLGDRFRVETPGSQVRPAAPIPTDSWSRTRNDLWMVRPSGGNAREVRRSRVDRANEAYRQREGYDGGVQNRGVQGAPELPSMNAVWAFPLDLEGSYFSVSTSSPEIQGRIVDASCVVFDPGAQEFPVCMPNPARSPVLILEASPSVALGMYRLDVQEGGRSVLSGEIVVPSPVSAGILSISAIDGEGYTQHSVERQDTWTPPPMRQLAAAPRSRKEYIVRYEVGQEQQVSAASTPCASLNAVDKSTPGELSISVSFPPSADVQSHQIGLVENVLDLPVSPCKVAMYPRIMDQIRWAHPGTAASVALANGLSLVEALQVAPAYMTFAGLGDSFGSGEGAPEDPFVIPWEDLTSEQKSAEADWLHVDCHRSSHSRLSIAAEEIARIPGLWVVYTNFACSGATMDGGFFGPPEGIKHPGEPGDDPNLQSQKAQLDQWMAQQGLQRLDAVLVSFGGNESGFSTLISKCAAPWLANGAECNDLGKEEIARVWEEVVAGNPDSLGWIGISNLAAKYQQVDSALGASVRTVYLNEYPNPLFYNPFLPCRRGLRYPPDISLHPQDEGQNDNLFGLGGNLDYITEDEALFLSEHFVDELRTVMSNAAESMSRWVFVDGQTEQAIDHGWCASEPWFNNFRDTRDKQHTVHGVLHPNEEGFKYMGLVLAQAIRDHENLPPSTRSQVVSSKCYPIFEYEDVGATKFKCSITLSPSDLGAEEAALTAEYAAIGESPGTVVDFTNLVRTAPWHDPIKRPDFEVTIPAMQHLRSVRWVIRNPDGSVAAEKVYSIQ